MTDICSPLSRQLVVDLLSPGAPIDLDTLVQKLSIGGVQFPERDARIIAWEFVENGYADFNDDWYLQKL